MNTSPPNCLIRFTQADYARAIRGAAQTGLPVVVDVLRDGTIRSFVNCGINPAVVEDKTETDLQEQPEPEL